MGRMDHGRVARALRDFEFDIQMQSDRLNSKAEDIILASELKDIYEAQEKQHIETGNRK